MVKGAYFQTRYCGEDISSYSDFEAGILYSQIIGYFGARFSFLRLSSPGVRTEVDVLFHRTLVVIN